MGFIVYWRRHITLSEKLVISEQGEPMMYAQWFQVINSLYAASFLKL